VEVARKIREGRLRPSELECALRIPHKSLYRAIDCLKAIGVIRKGDDGMYEWVESWQVFLEGEGYRLKLNHSKELLKRSEFTDITDWDLSDEHLVQHLQSGYPEIYREYEVWQESEKGCKEARERYEGAIRKYAAEHGFEIVDYVKLEAGKKQVSHHIYEDAEDYLRYKHLEEMRIVWRDGEIWDDYRGLALAKEKDLAKEVEELLRGLVRSENIQKAFIEMERATKLRDKAHFNYRKDVEWLALKVKHGEPLKGWCDLCPRVVIKQKP
jgi:hypothetical protein